MKFKGRLIDITKDIITREFRITIGVRHIPSGLDALKEEDLDISLKKWREPRSLTANAYYWTLVGKIADAIHAPTSVVHNWLLRDYGTLEIMEGDVLTIIVPETDEARARVERAEDYHLKPTGHLQEGKDGKMYREWLVIKGSHGYDTKEMSRLIDGAVQEAKDLGIETLPPEYLERMVGYAKHCAG